MSADDDLDPAIESWLEKVDAHWRSRGLSFGVRVGLGEELLADLREALAIGATPDELITPDPQTFAEQVAAASGVRMSEPRRALVSTAPAIVGVGLAGAAGGAAAIWIVAFPFMVPLLDRFMVSPTSDLLSILFVYAVFALLTTACAVGAIAYVWRADPFTPRLVSFVAPAILLSGAASVLPTMGLAGAFGYRTDVPLVILEILLVTAFVTGGILAGRWAALRRPRSPAPVQSLS